MICDELVVLAKLYTLFKLKRSHRYPVCPSKAHQGARKAAVTCKRCHTHVFFVPIFYFEELVTDVKIS